jgi:TolB-like protein/DNA-binding winged helix-turn-helix (wHTH) protein/Tfp pilus assembly protein PilF
MSTPNPYESIVRFSCFELDFPGRTLRKSGMRVRCQGQPLQVLATLLEKPGVLISREEIRQRLWPQDTFVDFDHALNTAIKKLRCVLNDDADTPRYIETVPRRGYRFIGSIQPETRAASESPVTPPPSPDVSRDPSPSRYRAGFVAAGLGFVVVFLALYFLHPFRAREGVTSAASQPAMLAVLPFQNMTSDPAQDSFSDGMTEEATTRLARLNSSRFRVIARTSAMKYKDVRKSVTEIARELHADYLLEGSVRREGPRVRISCQLIRAADQSPSWTQEYNFDSGDPLSLETNVAETIAGQLNALLGDPAATPHLPVNDKAFDSYLRGLAESSIHTSEGLDHIIAAFERAAGDDPNRAQPFAGLAHVYERGANLGFLQPAPAYAKARAAAERAIRLDPSLPESHVYLADAMLTIDYDWQGAQAEIHKALSLNDSDPMAHEWNGIFLAIQNQPELALREMRHAVELDPLNADRKIFLAGLLGSSGRRPEAEEQLKNALELDPSSELAHSVLICLYTSWGRQTDAISEWGAYFSLQGQLETASIVKSVYRKSGFDAATRYALKAKLALLTRLREHRYVSSFSLAVIHAQLGDKDQAILWLQKSYQYRDVELPCLSSPRDDTFAAVRNDPRVLAIVNRIRPPQ